MFRHHIAVVLCCMFVATLSHASDLKIAERSTTRGIPSRTSTTYISGRRTRSESRTFNMFPAWRGGPTVFSYGHRTAAIYQCDARRDIFLDLDSHEYTSIEIDEQGRPAGPRPMGTPMPLQPSGATLTVNIEDIDTGERKVMFGYAARHIIRTERHVPGPGAISLAQESKRDGWYIDLDMPEGCPPRNRFAGAFVLVSSSMDGRIDKIEIHHTGVTEAGYPLEVTDSPFSKTEVTELRTAPLDPALFELPAGFKQVQQLKSQAPGPPSSTLLRLWAWGRQSLSELFHKTILFLRERLFSELPRATDRKSQNSTADH